MIDPLTRAKRHIYATNSNLINNYKRPDKSSDKRLGQTRASKVY